MLTLASRYVDQLPELIAYQLFIVQHSRKFDYPSWLHYDIEFRRWAAGNKFKQWSQIHPQFYALAFTARSRVSNWCPVCHVDGGQHAFDCPRFRPAHQPTPYHPAAPVQHALFTPHQAPFKPPRPTPYRLRPPQEKRSKPEHCILYNKYDGNCPYGDNCRYYHVCARSGCGKQHPWPSEFLSYKVKIYKRKVNQ